MLWWDGKKIRSLLTNTGLQPIMHLSNSKKEMQAGTAGGGKGETGRQTDTKLMLPVMINGQFIGQILTLSKFYER